MNFEVIPISAFQKQAKRLIKKFPSLRQELFDLIESLKKNPEQGTSLGEDCYKIRLSIASKNKGKSGGARVITCVLVAETEVFLLSIYDKSEKSSLNDKEIKDLIKLIKDN
ncbi:hypothetical protein ABID42_003887 [Arcicella rosea]|uniref:type II toxin-antitoxin system RelE/ParE family toxin n=1 Tax=Arcicella rosea TaxID=502909 RepID=UPI00345CC976